MSILASLLLHRAGAPVPGLEPFRDLPQLVFRQRVLKVAKDGANIVPSVERVVKALVATEVVLKGKK